MAEPTAANEDGVLRPAAVLTELEARMLANPKLVTQMGNQGHSSEGARLINEWIQAGVIGPVHEVYVWTNRPVVYWPQGIPRPIKVNVNGRIDEDNSFYSPGTKALTFGRGGVDDAEDAEIILHEYGHSIQDNQVPGFGASAQAGYANAAAIGTMVLPKPVLSNCTKVYTGSE